MTRLMHPAARRRPPVIHIVLALLLGLVCWLAPPLAGAQQTSPPRLDIETMNRELGLIEAHLERQIEDDVTLTRLRLRLEPIIAEAQAMLARELPRLEVINARLNQIGPKPDEKAPPESAEVARARAEQDGLKKEVDEAIRVARLLLVRIEQNQNQIADQRRSLFKRATLERTSSILSLTLWTDVARAVPAAVANLQASLTFRARQLANNLEVHKLGGAVLLLVLALLTIVPARRLTGRWIHMQDGDAAPSRGRKALGALRSVVVASLLPTAIALVLFAVLDLLDLGNDRYGILARHLMAALVALMVLRALTFAVLAPGRPRWRLLAISDETAALMANTVMLVLVISIFGKIVEATNQAISAALPFTVATRGLTAVMIAGAILFALRRLGQRELAQQTTGDDFEQYDPTDRGLATIAKLGAGCFALALLVSALTGYVALASFLADQVIWGLAVCAILYLLLSLADEYLGRGLVVDSSRSRRLSLVSGLSTAAVHQIGILASGVLKLILYIVTFFLIIAPLGVDSGDIIGSLRAAFFGFQLGGVTISLSSIVFALATFFIGAFVTRSMHRWLEKAFLPNTSLDIGLQNSITTIFGYIGFIASALLAMSFLGLGLDKITIFAGALSVGIGFGLKEIVNNFVSGLILLWERPIRVGDWIVVGEEQGKVQRINVRSTQIETFDKASLIVPNSEFISGRVKNFMHANRMTRIIIPIGVGYESDPDVVKKLLLDTALAHREILSEPAPIVLFTKLGDFSLDFELRCFVDVDAVATTRSELLFEIFRHLKSHHIEVPFPRRTVDIADMQGLGKAIAENLPGHTRPA